LVLLDEPFSGLDAHLRAETREAVMRALEAEGATAVLVTHDQAEALSMGREVAVLRAGRLAQTAAPGTLYREPVDLDVARFVGDAIVLPGTARDGMVDCALGRLPARRLPPEASVDVMIRPEQLRLLPAPQAPRASGSGPLAEVTGERYYGPDTAVRLLLQDAARTPLLARTSDPNVPGAGEIVELSVVGPVAVYPSSTTTAPAEETRVERLTPDDAV
jgi:iron(III) transport system ATP-binding protein